MKARGWTFVRVCCLSKGIVAFTCALVVRNGRTHSEREAARTVENNPPRRTKCRGRTWETRATRLRCSLSDCTLLEDEAQVHQKEREKEGKEKERESRKRYLSKNRMYRLNKSLAYVMRNKPDFKGKNFKIAVFRGYSLIH